MAEMKVTTSPHPQGDQHLSWAALTLADLLINQDGYDRTNVACAFLAAAQSIIRQTDQGLDFAIVMAGAADVLAFQSTHTEN